MQEKLARSPLLHNIVCFHMHNITGFMPGRILILIGVRNYLIRKNYAAPEGAVSHIVLQLFISDRYQLIFFYANNFE